MYVCVNAALGTHEQAPQEAVSQRYVYVCMRACIVHVYMYTRMHYVYMYEYTLTNSQRHTYHA
jgi:hypothetical protein